MSLVWTVRLKYKGFSLQKITPNWHPRGKGANGLFSLCKLFPWGGGGVAVSGVAASFLPRTFSELQELDPKTNKQTNKARPLVAHTLNPSTLEAEAGGSLSSWTNWSTE